MGFRYNMKAPLPMGVKYDVTAGFPQGAGGLVLHSANLPFIWSDIRDDFPKHQAVAKGMRAYYTSFIRTGDVNNDSLPNWAASSTDAPALMEISLDDFAMKSASEEETRCNFWGNLFKEESWYTSCLKTNPPTNHVATCPVSQEPVLI